MKKKAVLRGVASRGKGGGGGGKKKPPSASKRGPTTKEAEKEMPPKIKGDIISLTRKGFLRKALTSFSERRWV